VGIFVIGWGFCLKGFYASYTAASKWSTCDRWAFAGDMTSIVTLLVIEQINGIPPIRPKSEIL